MKKISLLCIVVIGFFALVSTAYADGGNIYTVEGGAVGVKPTVTRGKPYKLNAFHLDKEKKINNGAGLAYGMVQWMYKKSKIMLVTLEPGGYIGNHGGPANYIAIVASGDGVYGHGTDNGEAAKLKGNEIKFKKGDVIVIKPYTYKWWKGGKERVELWVIEYPGHYN